MRYINWNIKCKSNTDKIIGLLKEKCLTYECIIALQEVMPEAADAINNALGDTFHIEYSLEYRRPGDFDTNNRKLGVMFLVSKDIDVLEAGVCERNVFPERTLYASVNVGGKRIKIVTLHSLTGVSFKMAKAIQFRTFAEFMKAYSPDIVSFDANEPEIDHYDISQMEFFNQGQGEDGKGAKLFFESLNNEKLRDVLVDYYDKSKYIKGEPLEVSHVIGSTKKKRRYDFIFARDNLKIKSVNYLYKESILATSDHAMVMVDLCDVV